MIWTEKYRPQKFEEFNGQTHVTTRVKALVEQRNIPHILFAGPAGVGKSTLALIVAKQLFQEDWRTHLLELNASDERGINVVRETIKDFARTQAIADIPFKVIFLDECDSLTREAQQALRRTMETYSNTCRFILSCNYFSKIIDPIKSRCAVFKFRPLQKEEAIKIIENICIQEKLSIDKDAEEELLRSAEGDARRIVNFLQAATSITKNITKETVNEIVSKTETQAIKEILQYTQKQDFLTARSRLLDVMLYSGLSGLDIIKTIQKEIINLNIENTKKLNYVEKCGEIEFRLVEGSDEFLQLEALLANLSK